MSKTIKGFYQQMQKDEELEQKKKDEALNKSQKDKQLLEERTATIASSIIAPLIDAFEKEAVENERTFKRIATNNYGIYKTQFNIHYIKIEIMVVLSIIGKEFTVEISSSSKDHKKKHHLNYAVYDDLTTAKLENDILEGFEVVLKP